MRTERKPFVRVFCVSSFPWILIFRPLQPLQSFVPRFWFERGSSLADRCFWLPSDLYNDVSVMRVNTAPGSIVMPSSEEELGLPDRPWSLLCFCWKWISLAVEFSFNPFVLQLRWKPVLEFSQDGYSGEKIKKASRITGMLLMSLSYVMKKVFFLCQSVMDLQRNLLASLVHCCSWWGPWAVLNPETCTHQMTSVTTRLPAMILLFATN